jgi:glutaredoxin
MVFSFLFGRRRGRQRPDLRVVLYTRHGCHLCDAAWQILDEARRRHGFALEAIDVDSAAELAMRYGTCVPVVTVNGRLRFRGAVNPVLLQRILDVSPAQP